MSSSRQITVKFVGVAMPPDRGDAQADGFVIGHRSWTYKSRLLRKEKATRRRLFNSNLMMWIRRPSRLALTFDDKQGSQCSRSREASLPMSRVRGWQPPHSPELLRHRRTDQ